MIYAYGQKIRDKHSGELFIIDSAYAQDTPNGKTIIFEIRSRKKRVQNQHLTLYMLDTYFEIVP